MKLRASIALALMVFSIMGCEQKTAPAEPPAKPPTSEVTPQPPDPEEPAVAAESADAGAKPLATSIPAFDPTQVADDEWCSAAHSDHVKLLTAMKKSMERAGREADLPIPEEKPWVDKCNTLPLPMRQCMVIAYAMRASKECSKRQEELAEEHQATYGWLVGK